jgi:hypothetical protein
MNKALLYILLIAVSIFVVWGVSYSYNGRLTLNMTQTGGLGSTGFNFLVDSTGAYILDSEGKYICCPQ